MVTLNLPIYKVVTRYFSNKRNEKEEVYFLDYYKALAYAEKNSIFAHVAMHEMEEDEDGGLSSCKCLKIW